MDRVTMMADLSIRRACGFAAFGIGSTMAALSFDPVLCFRTGALLFAVTAAVLWVMGHDAPRRNVRRTELWTLLGGRAPVPETHVQKVLGGVLRERYLWHATLAGIVAVTLWLVALLFMLIRRA
jgi:hypothetical protein